MSFPRVFIIVLHYGIQETTYQCLKSLNLLNYPNFEVIVIDNDPKHRLADFDFPFKITKIVNAENLGFSGGNNAGIRYALEKGADYVLLLNNDAKIIDNDFLKNLVLFAEKNDQLGILGPVIYRENTNEIHFSGGKINWLYNKAEHRKGKNDYITGACLLIKRRAIEKIGLMPEEYFLYFEDAEWCLRARRAGFLCAVVPRAKIAHKVSENAKEYSFSYVYYHYRNGLLFAKRNAPFLIKIIAYKISFFNYLKELIKLIFMPSKRQWAKAAMKGIGDFWKGKTGKLA